MKTLALAIGCAAFLGFAPACAADLPEAPYSGQERREIKALAPDVIAGLEGGAGLGFAKSAELNGYPGPAHLLELAERIPLDADQAVEIRRIEARMRAAAIVRGAALLEAERRIEAAFRDRTVDSTALAPLLAEAGLARAQVRAAHLDAHIDATALLRPDQIDAYARLRGYAPPVGGAHGQGQGQGHDHGRRR